MSTLQRLGPDHAAAYRTLMLAAYAEAPDAFVATVAERAAQPLSFWLDRLDPAPGAATCSFGAFEGDTLLGAASLQFETRPKTRHKASLLGMFVSPAARRHGLGEQLVRAVLAEARSRTEARVVVLTVTEGNTVAEALYARCGFQRFGVEPLAMRDPDTGTFFNKVHMACLLQPHQPQQPPQPSAA